MNTLLAIAFVGVFAFLLGRYVFPKKQPDPRPGDGSTGGSGRTERDGERSVTQRPR